MTDTDKKFYQMKLVPDSVGLTINTRVFRSIHETECMFFCVSDYDFGYVNTAAIAHGCSQIAAARMRKVPIKRVHKSGSRIAFPTEEEAFDHLRFLKSKQLAHLERDIKFVRSFLVETEGKDIHELKARPDEVYTTVPNTHRVVNDHLLFD